MQTKFWKALDALTDAATDQREWSILLGNELDGLLGHRSDQSSPILRSTGQLATSISCPSPGGEGCPRQIMHHEGGAIRAVCGDTLKACADLSLARDDIMIYGLDRIGLARRITAALDLSKIPAKLERRTVFRIGFHEVFAGQGFPIFLTVPGPFPNVDLAQFDDLADHPGPQLLLTPTSSSIPTHLTTVLDRMGVSRLALEDILDFDDRGRLRICQPTSVLFAGLRHRVMDQLESSPQLAWSLPTDARWEEISIRFISEEVINGSFRGETRRFESDDLRMKNTKNGKPKMAWSLLKILASQGGRLPLRPTKEADTAKYQKQKQALSDALRAAFGISGDPLPSVGTDYVARFTASAVDLQQGKQGQSPRKFGG